MVDAHCVRDERGFAVHVQWLLRFIGLGLGSGYIKFEDYVRHMPEAFTETFVADIFFHGPSYRGSFHRTCF